MPSGINEEFATICVKGAVNGLYVNSAVVVAVFLREDKSKIHEDKSKIRY